MAPLLGLAISAVPSIVKMLTDDKDVQNVASKAVDVAQAITGKPNPTEAEEALRSDPEAFARFRIEMESVAADLEKARLLDVQDARAMARDGVSWEHFAVVMFVLAMWGWVTHTVLSGGVKFGLNGIPDLVSGRLLTMVDAAVFSALGFMFGTMHRKNAK